ncbi:MAG: nucleoside phosphorylase [Candidatus Promineifilaceae bacterium]
MSRLPHTDLIPDSLPPLALVCGDPARADRVADFLAQAKRVANKREYRTYCGFYDGVEMAVCSHGIGAPGAAIAFEELAAAGAKTIIRAGTCGSLQQTVHEGDIVVVTGAVQWTGYGREVVPSGFPAIAHLDVVWQLKQSAANGKRPFHTGLVLTRDAFYEGIATTQTPNYETMAQANVLAVEMECAALFLFGTVRGVRTGAVLAVDGYVFDHKQQMAHFKPTRPIVAEAVDAEIEVALKALAALHHDDF